MTRPVRIGIVGGGWAGMAAAVTAVERGAHVSLFEAAPQLGGRARAMEVNGPDGASLTLDNGQHILIGAYTTTLGLMQSVGVPLRESLLRLPLGLPMAGGGGLCAPPWARNWPAPWGALAAVLGSSTWGWSDRWALLRLALTWWQHRADGDERTVAQACEGVPLRVMEDLIDPLCVSALNLPSTQASAQVFARVMRDALRGPGFAPWAASDLLLPRVDLGQLWPQTAAHALQRQRPDRWTCHLGQAIQGVAQGPQGWRLEGSHGSTDVDRVIWASSAAVAAKAMRALPASEALAWAAQVSALEHTAIATVYTHSPATTLDAPMLALRPGGGPNGAQFVFDRAQLSPHEPRLAGVWAWVVSACEGERDQITAAVMAQAQTLWPQAGLRHLQTVIDKRAAYACRPGTHKPAQRITEGVWAAGDYTEGPYPSTLEAATRSGVAAALAATSA
jgi:squalene-associated FAD-dependent desaturase